MNNRREEYLNRVLNYLVDDTIIDKNEYRLNAPFLPLFGSTQFHSNFIYFFIPYCMETYMLSEQESRFLWNQYRKIIEDKIKKYNSINESVDRKYEYLNKIVDFLVQDTEISTEDRTWLPPFKFTIDPPSDLYLNYGYLQDITYEHFSKYCKNIYGLTDEEIKYVWNIYRSIILDKIKNIRL